MIPDSSTVSPAFIEDGPDWSKAVSLTSRYRTTIIPSRYGGEQRARHRQRPRYSFSFVLSDLSTAELSKRRARTMSEVASPVVVPIWTDFYLLSSMPSVNVAEMGIDLARKKFKVGGYAYFVQSPTASTFRKIVAVGSTSITFAAVVVPAFTNGARVYPCILGMRQDDSAEFIHSKVDVTTEIMTVEEL